MSPSHDLLSLMTLSLMMSRSHDLVSLMILSLMMSPSYDLVSLMSLMICASYIGAEKYSMNDDKKDHDMDSASSADIALEDFLEECGGDMVGRVV